MKNFTFVRNLMTLSLFFAGGSVMAQTNLLSNNSFEEWTDGKPVHWVSTTTASSGTISQSADARTGEASVLLEGTSSGNKRLASEELNLKAGTYIFSIYAKAATGENASARPGYAPVNEDGSMGTYAYGVYHNDITNAGWVLVADTFELTEDTKLNLVVMNPKNPGKNILLDDASLTTEDGGLIEGGDVDPEPTEKIIFESSFTDGDVAGFEFKDVALGELSYVWKGDSYGYLKASAYANGANNAAESWAVSPVIDLTQETQATMSFRHALNFLKEGVASEHIQVLASSDYAGDVAAATWDELPITTYPSGSNWTFVDAGDIDLTAYCGKSVVIAFKYVSTTEVAPTWEVDNLKIFAPTSTGIQGVEADVDAPVEVYNLSGVKVGSSLDGLKSGIYLVKKGNKVHKVLK